jgi:type IV pilus assembly protein PilF
MKKYAIALSLIFTVSFLSACGRNVKRMEEADVHFQASKSLHSKGETIQSLAEAMKGAKIDPKNEEIQNFLGLLYAERGDTAQALEHFEKSVKLKPDYSEGQNNLCAFLLQVNKPDEALDHCQKAVQNVTYATPERAYNNMAMAYEKKGDATKTAEMHSKALLHNKKFVFSLLYLGKAAYEKRDYAKAKEHLSAADEACVASPKGAWGSACPESQYRLALTLLQLKETSQAVMAFEHCRASDSSPSNEYKIQCEKSLRMYQ